MTLREIVKLSDKAAGRRLAAGEKAGGVPGVRGGIQGATTDGTPEDGPKRRKGK